MYTLYIHPGGYGGDVHPVYTPWWVWEVYHPGIYARVYLPGYTMQHTRRSSVRTRRRCTAGCTSEEALGSIPRLI